MPNVIDALIQTKGGVQLRLQFGVRIDVIPVERLLDHEESKIVEALQVRKVGEGVGGVGIDRKLNPGKLPSNGGDEIDVFAGFDLQLDSLIAGG